MNKRLLSPRGFEVILLMKLASLLILLVSFLGYGVITQGGTEEAMRLNIIKEAYSIQDSMYTLLGSPAEEDYVNVELTSEDWRFELVKNTSQSPDMYRIVYSGQYKEDGTRETVHVAIFSFNGAYTQGNLNCDPKDDCSSTVDAKLRIEKDDDGGIEISMMCGSGEGEQSC